MLNRSSNKKPRDKNQLAKSIVDQATGTTPDPPKSTQPENVVSEVMREMGRKGGLKGGPARAEKLSPRKRKAIAKKAAAARWKDKDKPE